MKTYEIKYFYKENPSSRRKVRTEIIEAYDVTHVMLLLDIWRDLIIELKRIK
jgi:hypothetical protein